MLKCMVLYMNFSLKDVKQPLVFTAAISIICEPVLEGGEHHDQEIEYRSGSGCGL